MAVRSPDQLAINRSLLLLAVSVGSIVRPGPWTIGTSMMLAALGFQEFLQTLRDEGITHPPIE
jgi:hypothetical protein